jgi:crotonobetainyl-CoA:carnitine CoA-transferase CaiB-like acyl-CoA transferase
VSTAESSQGPLSGLRVIDLSSFIAGCYTALMLGDMGAEVIKIEPLSGDGARQWGPFLAEESRFFQGWNRNKRSIAVDMRSDEGREIAYSLVREADVLVENFRPGVTRRLKIDYETVEAINPRILYCSITAFGSKGPLSHRPGFDPVLQSMSGAARGNQRYAGKDCISGVAMSDFGAAMLGASGILAALYVREKTGHGQHVETSLLQAAMSMQSHMFVEALETEEKPPFGIYPYRLFETKDSSIFIAGPTDRFWTMLCKALGRSDLGEDSRFDSNAKRVDHAEALTAILQPIFRERTSADWQDYLVEQGVPCGPVQTYSEFFHSDQVTAMGMNPEVRHRSIGSMKVAGVPVTFEKTPGSVRYPPPELGEHSSEILRELKYTDEQIANLKSRSIVA